jgi:uncharacterized repeat protein (TIGR01451 family)
LIAHQKRFQQESIRQAMLTGCALLMCSYGAMTAGVPPGTLIESQATVDFDLAGIPTTLISNTTSLTVIERIDVVTVLQSPQILATAGDTNRALLFRITNTGHGSETFSLAIDNAIVNDDFDPVAAAPPIYFDTDASGDFTAADQAYVSGTNDPLLAADASIDVFFVNDIPLATANGEIGRSQLTASSITGTGPAGSLFPGSGDGGVDAIVGTTTGTAADIGEYIVADVQITVVKSQLVSDPLGGNTPLPGATIRYAITVDVIGTGTATASVLSDPIPTYASYVANSLSLNGVALTDLSDADAGEFDTAAAPFVAVQLGDLTLADGTQTIEFEVTID